VPIRTLLVVKPSSLGDIVHTLPVASLIKRAWPDTRLRWLINPEWAPLLEGNPDINEVIPFPRRELGGGTKVIKQVRWLRKVRARYRSDLVLDFQGLLRSAIVGRACRGQSFLGLSDAREGARFFYDRTAPVNRDSHAVDRYLNLAALLGLEITGPLEWKLPAGTPPACIETYLGQQEPFILLHPFSRGKGKSLSRKETEVFCRAVPFRVVVAGRTDEAPLTALPNVINLLNQTSISELIWLIRQARFVVSVDSGPMHIAAALQKPLLSIHTWSDPARVGPYHPEAWVLQDNTIFRMRQIGEPAESRLPAPGIEAVAAFVIKECGC